MTGIYTIAVIGGGRWSRVIVNVLCSLLDEGSHVLWCSRHNREAQETLVKKHSHIKFTLLQNDTALELAELDAAVIVTAPPTHAGYAQKYLSSGIPVFVEKPLTLSGKDADILLDIAREKNTPLGVDLVFMYADYIYDFVSALEGEEIRDISIEWHDPSFEERHGEKKYPDFYTAMTHDMFPHVWSLLKMLLPTLDLDLKKVRYEEPMAFSVDAKHAEIDIEMSFSRRAEKRSRIININDGASILDFTVEPGRMILNGEEVQGEWAGDMPLTQSLRDFLDVAGEHKKATGWRISAHACIASVYLAEQLDNMLREAQQKYISMHPSIDNDHDFLMDAFLPLESTKGNRFPVSSEADKKAFAAHVVSTYDMDKV